MLSFEFLRDANIARYVEQKGQRKADIRDLEKDIDESYGCLKEFLAAVKKNIVNRVEGEEKERDEIFLGFQIADLIMKLDLLASANATNLEAAIKVLFNGRNEQDGLKTRMDMPAH